MKVAYLSHGDLFKRTVNAGQAHNRNAGQTLRWGPFLGRRWSALETVDHTNHLQQNEGSSMKPFSLGLLLETQCSSATVQPPIPIYLPPRRTAMASYFLPLLLPYRCHSFTCFSGSARLPCALSHSRAVNVVEAEAGKREEVLPSSSCRLLFLIK